MGQEEQQQQQQEPTAAPPALHTVTPQIHHGRDAAAAMQRGLCDVMARLEAATDGEVLDAFGRADGASILVAVVEMLHEWRGGLAVLSELATRLQARHAEVLRRVRPAGEAPPFNRN